VDRWQTFCYDELFDIKKGTRLTKQDQTPGSTPYIGSSRLNNGVTAHIGQAPAHPAGCITVSYNGSIAEAFYQPRPFFATDDVNVFYPKVPLAPEAASSSAHSFGKRHTATTTGASGRWRG
jgi:type I restriction enzyme M protein